MNFYHLSHIDLDGYGCQYLTKLCFQNIRYFNSNYGTELRVNLNEILDDIKAKREPSFIFITDLNITLDDALYLDSEVKKLIECDVYVKLQLLDHHISGADVAQKYSWYFLNDKESATKITYNYLKDLGCEKILNSTIFELVETINSVDLWLEDSPYFELGKVFSRLVMESRELNKYIFEKESVDYKHNVLEKGLKYINIVDGHISLDLDTHFIKKQFFLNERDDTLENLSTEYSVKLLNLKKDELTIYYKGVKGLLTFSIGPISTLANRFLKQNPDYMFFLDVTNRGNIGIRGSDYKFDVSLMAKDLANGGGHFNASGGKLQNFKEAFSYREVKKFIEELIFGKEKN